MKNFNTVYNNSRNEELALRKAMHDRQKEAVVNVLKENYRVKGNISDLPLKEQENFAQRLMMYWSPKTGINKAGIDLLNENMMTLDASSSKSDIKLYIEKEVRKNIEVITEAYKQNNQQAVIESFKEDIREKTKKSLKESFINNVVWDCIENRIKLGILD